MTCTSRATERPALQFGMSISAGRHWESGTKLGDSLAGARAADSAAQNTTSRMALWRVIRSPFPPHLTLWSPKGLAWLWHSGQE